MQTLHLATVSARFLRFSTDSVSIAQHLRFRWCLPSVDFRSGDGVAGLERGNLLIVTEGEAIMPFVQVSRMGR